jgi:hypothetical protein
VEVDRIANVVMEAGGENVEGPMFKPEYVPNLISNKIRPELAP